MSTLDEIAAAEDALARVIEEYRDFKQSESGYVRTSATDPSTPQLPGSRTVLNIHNFRFQEEEMWRGKVERAEMNLRAIKAEWLRGLLPDA